MINVRSRQLAIAVITFSFLWLLPLFYRSWNRFRLLDFCGFLTMMLYGIWMFIASGRHRPGGTGSAAQDAGDQIKAITKRLAVPGVDRAELLHERALLQISQQEWERAVEDFTAALESAGEQLRSAEKLMELYHYRGVALVRLERFKEALQDLNVAVRWIETYPEKAGTVFLGETLAERADCFLAEKEDKLAEGDLRKAIPLLEGEYLVDSRIQLGAILEGSSQWKDAFEEYELALIQVSAYSEDPQWRGSVQYAQARTLRAMNRFEDAAKVLGEAISVMSSDEKFAEDLKNVRLMRADTWLHCGELTKAASDAAIVLQKHPKDSYARVIRALIAAEKLEFREALKELEDVLEQDPDHLSALQNYAVLLTGVHDDSLRNGATALELAEKLAAQMGSQHWYPLSVRAAAHAELGDFPKAIELAEQSLNAAPSEEKARRQRRLEQFRQHRPFRCEPLAPQRAQTERSA